MFPFQRLTVYKKAKSFHREMIDWLLQNPEVDRIIANQLKRAPLSIPLYIAEGAGRFTKPDQKNFFIISRASVFECVAILDILVDSKLLSGERMKEFFKEANEISRILFAMIRRFEK